MVLCSKAEEYMICEGFNFSQLSAKFDCVWYLGFSSRNQFVLLDCKLSDLTDVEILVKSLKGGFLEYQVDLPNRTRFATAHLFSLKKSRLIGDKSPKL